MLGEEADAVEKLEGLDLIRETLQLGIPSGVSFSRGVETTVACVVDNGAGIPHPLIGFLPPRGIGGLLAGKERTTLHHHSRPLLD